LHAIAENRNFVTMETTKRIALFTGTFDPFTIGHQSIVARALPLFDQLIIAVAVSKLKHTQAEINARVAAIEAVYAGNPAIAVKAYDDLTADLARREQARFVLRGIRSVKDFEYERDIAGINHRLSGVETVLLFTEPHYADISSTIVRELLAFGKDVSEFLPQVASLD